LSELIIMSVRPDIAAIDGPPRQVVAEEQVGRRGGYAADRLAGVDLLEDGAAKSLEIGNELEAEPMADVVETDIARGVGV